MTSFARVQIFLGAICLWLGGAPALAAGGGFELRLQTRSLASPDANAVESTALVHGRLLAIDLAAAGASVRLIFDGEALTLTTVDEEAGTYSVLSADTLALAVTAIHRQIAAAASRFEAQIAALPPDKREAVEAQLQSQLDRLTAIGRGRGASRLELRPTGASQEIEGQQCAWHQLFRDGELIRELCVVPWPDLGLAGDALRVLGDLGAFTERVREQMPEGVDVTTLDSPFVGVQQAPGLPIRVRVFESGEARTEITLRLRREETLSTALFAVPEGLRQVGLLRVE